MTLICFAAISGSYATTYHDSKISYKNDEVLVSTNLNNLISDKHELTIELPCNPSTGYEWIAEYDPSQVALLDMSYIPNLPIICGSGGVDVFKFMGKKGAAIHMKYIRAWEKKPIKTRTYYIK
jgi:predicted secreted protein